jgi:hypothetical protein
MPMATETDVPNRLTMSREPKGPSRAGDKGSPGDLAFKDAVLVIIVAWSVLLLLAYTLRAHNI